jgi:betaine-aldehyde dehydrogenase
MHWINGEWAATGELRDSINPATYEVIGRYYDGGKTEAERAIVAANAAFRNTPWRRDAVLRADILAQLADRFEARAREFIDIYKLENGKPEALQEISRVAPAIRYWSAMARTQKGACGHPNPDALSLTLREPVGVAAVIVPWNSPIILAMRSINPALAAGCTVACKMPGQTAQICSLLSQVFSEVEGLPAGVVNFFNEHGAAGSQWLVSSPDTRAVSFTGGTSTGSKIGQEAGRLIKACGLELGGKNAHLVFEDADVAKLMPVLRVAAMRFGGQYCEAGSRVIVQRSLFDRVLTELTAELRQVKVGPANSLGTELGPLLDKESVTRVDKMVQTAIEAGAEPILRGGPINEGPLARGAFFAPAFLVVKDHDLPIVHEEIFGPVMTLETFDEEREGVRLVNGTKYGLGGSVWTSDIARAFRVAEAFETGMVWINDWGKVHYQFEEGGFKQSGLGRLNGPAALELFTEIKHITFATVS